MWHREGVGFFVLLLHGVQGAFGRKLGHGDVHDAWTQEADGDAPGVLLRGDARGNPSSD